MGVCGQVQMYVHAYHEFVSARGRKFHTYKALLNCGSLSHHLARMNYKSDSIRIGGRARFQLCAIEVARREMAKAEGD